LTSWPFSFAGKISRAAGRNKKSVAAAPQVRLNGSPALQRLKPGKLDAIRCAIMFTVLNMFN
jgi:hypothetical protein